MCPFEGCGRAIWRISAQVPDRIGVGKGVLYKEEYNIPNTHKKRTLTSERLLCIFSMLKNKKEEQKESRKRKRRGRKKKSRKKKMDKEKGREQRK